MLGLLTGLIGGGKISKSILSTGLKVVDELYESDEEKNIAQGHKIQDLLEMVPNAKTMPQIWLDDEHIGGYPELEKKLYG